MTANHFPLLTLQWRKQKWHIFINWKQMIKLKQMEINVILFLSFPLPLFLNIERGFCFILFFVYK